MTYFILSILWQAALRLFFIFWRCFRISKVSHKINEEIREREVRLISEEGAQMGIVPIEEALAAAQERGLDLVMIAPKAKPLSARQWITENLGSNRLRGRRKRVGSSMLWKSRGPYDSGHRHA